jgi:hypothetical protein
MAYSRAAGVSGASDEILQMCRKVYFSPSDNVHLSASTQGNTTTATITCETPAVFPAYPAMQTIFTHGQASDTISLEASSTYTRQ